MQAHTPRDNYHPNGNASPLVALAFQAIEQDNLPLLRSLVHLECDEVELYFVEQLVLRSVQEDELRQAHVKAELLYKELQLFRAQHPGDHRYTNAQLDKLKEQLDNRLLEFYAKYEKDAVRVHFRARNGLRTHLEVYEDTNEGYMRYLRDLRPSLSEWRIGRETQEHHQSIDHLTTRAKLDAYIGQLQANVATTGQALDTFSTDDALPMRQQEYKGNHYLALKQSQRLEREAIVDSVLRSNVAADIMRALSCENAAEVRVALIGSWLDRPTVSMFLALDGPKGNISLFEYAQQVGSQGTLLYMLQVYERLGKYYPTDKHQVLSRRAHMWLLSFGDPRYALPLPRPEEKSEDDSIPYRLRVLYQACTQQERQAFFKRLLREHPNRGRMVTLLHCYRFDPLKMVEDIAPEDKPLMAYVLGRQIQTDLFYLSALDKISKWHIANQMMLLHLFQEPAIPYGFKKEAMWLYLGHYSVEGLKPCRLMKLSHPPSPTQKDLVEKGEYVVAYPTYEHRTGHKKPKMVFCLGFFSKGQRYEECRVTSEEVSILFDSVPTGEVRQPQLRDSLFELCVSNGGASHLIRDTQTLTQELSFYLRMALFEELDQSPDADTESGPNVSTMSDRYITALAFLEGHSNSPDIVRSRMKELWSFCKELQRYTGCLKYSLWHTIHTALMRCDGMESFEYIEQLLDKLLAIEEGLRLPMTLAQVAKQKEEKVPKQKHPLAPETFTGLLEEKPTHFTVQQLLGDGNCGFYGLVALLQSGEDMPAMRQAFAQWLSAHKDQPPVKETLLKEMMDALIVMTPDEKGIEKDDLNIQGSATCAQEFRRRGENREELMQRIRAQYPDMPVPSREEDTMIPYMRQHTQIYGAHLAEYDALDPLEPVRKFCERPDVIDTYIQGIASVGKRWMPAHLGVLFAQSRGLALTIFGDNGQVTSQPNQDQGAPNLQSGHMRLRGGHYDLLLPADEKANVASAVVLASTVSSSSSSASTSHAPLQLTTSESARSYYWDLHDQALTVQTQTGPETFYASDAMHSNDAGFEVLRVTREEIVFALLEELYGTTLGIRTSNAKTLRDELSQDYKAQLLAGTLDKIATETDLAAKIGDTEALEQHCRDIKNLAHYIRFHIGGNGAMPESVARRYAARMDRGVFTLNPSGNVDGIYTRSTSKRKKKEEAGTANIEKWRCILVSRPQDSTEPYYSYLVPGQFGDATTFNAQRHGVQQLSILATYLSCRRYLYANVSGGHQPQKHALLARRIHHFFERIAKHSFGNIRVHISDVVLKLLQKPSVFENRQPEVVGFTHHELHNAIHRYSAWFSVDTMQRDPVLIIFSPPTRHQKEDVRAGKLLLIECTGANDDNFKFIYCTSDAPGILKEAAITDPEILQQLRANIQKRETKLRQRESNQWLPRPAAALNAYDICDPQLITKLFTLYNLHALYEHNFPDCEPPPGYEDRVSVDMRALAPQASSAIAGYLEQQPEGSVPLEQKHALSTVIRRVGYFQDRRTLDSAARRGSMLAIRQNFEIASPLFEQPDDSTDTTTLMASTMLDVVHMSAEEKQVSAFPKLKLLDIRSASRLRHTFHQIWCKKMHDMQSKYEQTKAEMYLFLDQAPNLQLQFDPNGDDGYLIQGIEGISDLALSLQAPSTQLVTRQQNANLPEGTEDEEISQLGAALVNYYQEQIVLTRRDYHEQFAAYLAEMVFCYLCEMAAMKQDRHFSSLITWLDTGMLNGYYYNLQNPGPQIALISGKSATTAEPVTCLQLMRLSGYRLHRSDTRQEVRYAVETDDVTYVASVNLGCKTAILEQAQWFNNEICEARARDTWYKQDSQLCWLSEGSVSSYKELPCQCEPIPDVFYLQTQPVASAVTPTTVLITSTAVPQATQPTSPPGDSASEQKRTAAEQAATDVQLAETTAKLQASETARREDAEKVAAEKKAEKEKATKAEQRLAALEQAFLQMEQQQKAGGNAGPRP